MKAKTKNIKINPLTSSILYILFFAFIVRIVLSFFGTLQLDQGTFIAWSSSLANYGFKNFYNSWSDYLPGYLYFLWGLGKINLLGILPPVLLYKIPAILSDILTGYLIYKILGKYKNEKWGLAGSLIYVFNPAIIANSTLWGQVDSLTALATVTSIYFLDSKFLLSAVILSAGTLIKPQAAFILPIIFLLMIKDKWGLLKVVKYIFSGLFVFVLGFAPFAKGNLIQFIFDRLSLSANQYPYNSINAFNFWGLFGFWKPDGNYLQFGSYILVLIATVIVYFKSSRNKFTPYSIAAFIFASSFMFFTRMHERHLLPIFAPLAIVAIDNPLFLIPYVGFSFIYVINLIYSYFWISNDFIQVIPDFLIKFLIVFGMGLLFFIFYATIEYKNDLWKRVLGLMKRFLNKIKSRRVALVRLSEVKLTKKKLRIFLFIVLGFAFVTRIFNLGNPPTMYFDEVYHAFTAKVMIGTDATKAWEWWNTPPSGFAYEWTHPPLAKLGMILGMTIFGQNSFGYRVPGALLGVGAVFLIYLIAKNVFKDEVIGLLSAAVFSLDGLPLVMSRIGMNDSYILFFSLLSIYLFSKQKDFFSAVSFGLAISSKWSALWAAPIIFVLWLKRKEKFRLSILWFLFLPFAIYILVYLPMFTTGHDFATWWGMQKQMWWYHTGLRATHPYTSPWWSWPLLIRPIYLYTSEEVGGMVSRIYAMGNPFVFWFGTVSVAVCAVTAFFEKNKKLGLIVFSYLIFFAPWAASPRIMFLYHYLPSIPFLSIATAYVLRRNPKLIFGYLLICLLAFVYFYPHWTGLQVPLWLDRSYYWVTSWR